MYQGRVPSVTQLVRRDLTRKQASCIPSNSSRSASLRTSKIKVPGSSTRLLSDLAASPCTGAMHYHVLGAGSIGSLFAHHLASRGNTVTLLLRSRERLKDFTQHHGSSIHLAPRPGAPPVPVPVRAELVAPTAAAPAAGPPIDNLLVATKAHVTAGALASIQQRLHPLSCVVLLQNGALGVHDQLCREVFQDPEQRPLFLLGSTTHGAFRTHPFSVTHAGHGQCVFGQPQQQEQELGEVLGDCSAAQQPSSTTSSSTGAVRGHHNHTAGTAGRQQQEPGQQLHQQQQQQQQRRERLRVVLASLASLQELQPDVTLSAEALAGQLLVKLTVNCCANPLSALLRCKNGGLNDNPPVQQLQALLVAECKAVFGDALPGTCEELLAHVQHVVSFNASNYNSMLQSVLSGHVTEVEYLNGYVVQQGRRAGVPTPVNELLCTLVQGVEAVPEHYRAAALTPHPTPS